MKFKAFVSCCAIVLSIICTAYAQDPPRVADLGSCELESGSSIERCFVTYRVFGKLNPEKNNAVLVPTWFGGRSEDWLPYLGKEAYIDTTRYFTVIVDAFGNGSSSSPSNSETQGGASFPEISIGDMVSSQYRLVTEHLGLEALHAIVGISMGGMQAFEWSIAHPDFAKVVIPIVGSPRLGAYDLILWKALLSSIAEYQDRPDAAAAIASDIAPLLLLIGSTPRRINHIDPGAVDSTLEATIQTMAAIQFDDFASQLEAMISHDVSRHHGYDMTLTAESMRANMLVVFSPDDHVVTYFPAEIFAETAGAKILSVPSECGHGVTGCELTNIGQEIRLFLDSAF